MSQVASDYISKRILAKSCTQSGDILTECEITFDNGKKVTGSSIRDFSTFNKEEAESAACENAINDLVSGVDFILSKI